MLMESSKVKCSLFRRLVIPIRRPRATAKAAPYVRLGTSQVVRLPVPGPGHAVLLRSSPFFQKCLFVGRFYDGAPTLTKQFHLWQMKISRALHKDYLVVIYLIGNYSHEASQNNRHSKSEPINFFLKLHNKKWPHRSCPSELQARVMVHVGILIIRTLLQI